MQTITLEQYHQMIAKPKKPSKYGNITTYVGNIRFDSKAEAARYTELKMLQRTGKISGHELQPSFELQPKFKGADGKTIRAITYRADFQYNENGRVVVEDVKGKETKDFIIKKKIFMQKYPHVDFRLIK